MAELQEEVEFQILDEKLFGNITPAVRLYPNNCKKEIMVYYLTF